jgi:hypothetical protein
VVLLSLILAPVVLLSVTIPDSSQCRLLPQPLALFLYHTLMTELVAEPEPEPEPVAWLAVAAASAVDERP